MDGRSHTGLTFYPNLSFVRVHHVLHDLGAKSSAAFLGVDSPGRKEAVSNFGGHSRTSTAVLSAICLCSTVGGLRVYRERGKGRYE
jgi:hypothetical protein